MRRSLLVFLPLLVLSACATLVTGRPEYQQLLVTQRYDAAYLRAQAVAVGLGLHIVRTQDQAHIFTAKRPASGEEVTVTIAPSGMGCLLTFQGTPPHDVTDLVRVPAHAFLGRKLEKRSCSASERALRGSRSTRTIRK